jgi:hypothetical protein
MAHFAELDNNNIITQVVVINNKEVPDEVTGIEFCKSLYGENTNWIQTSYNRNIRKNFAGIGYTYDPTADHFFAPQPYPSWILDADAKWQAPVPRPIEEEKLFIWDESTLSWKEVTE